MDRDWAGLKLEASHLAEGAQNFGFVELSEDVNRALEVLNTSSLSKTAINTEAKAAMESLFKKLDRFLVEEQDR